MSPFRRIVSALFFCLVHTALVAKAEILTDIEYAKVGEKGLLLDLFLPEGKPDGLVIYVHGGGWSSGSKSDCPIRGLRNLGFAVASVDYRLSGEAPFPANVHDIKAAVRFLRAKAGEFGFPENRIAIAGSSAGGHLAALVGLSSEVNALEGSLGEYPQVSSRVGAVVSFFGAGNLNTILEQSTPFGLQMRVPALQMLLGGALPEKRALATLASPVTHADAGDPPVLLLHGDADPQMPPQQSEELAAACRQAGIAVTLRLLPGSRHGGREFYDAPQLERVRAFLHEALSR